MGQLEGLTAAQAIVVVWALLGAVHFLALLSGAVALRRRCPRLADLRPRMPLAWPSLSVVIAAFDEADTIEPALESLLAQDGPRLQIVVADDRSSDGTGEIVDRLAARDARISVVHVRELPEGWLGKVHALARGLERATGTWVLFTDADVRFAPGALRQAIAYAEDEGIDHLVVHPEVVSRSFWVGVGVAAATRTVFALAKPWETADPGSKKAAGAGAFNLVRRAAFDRTPGFAWLKLEVADDVGLGAMVKAAGGRSRFVLGRDVAEVEMYRTPSDAVRGFEKNAFAQAARFSLWRGLLLAVIGAMSALGAFAAFLPAGVSWLPLVGVIALCAHVATARIVSRTTASSLAYGLLAMPLGDLLLACATLRATLVCVRRGGLAWRGTVYPTALLRAGRRVTF